MTKGLFSVIVAVYNVEDYIESFFLSLEKQTLPIADLDIVMVDDGSSDSSYSMVMNWAKKFPGTVRFATKDNGGPASARNVALGMVKNKWVTVIDPDDAVQPDYFQRVEEFLLRDTRSQAVMLSTRMLIWQEETGQISPTHPLDRKFRFGDRLVDLEKEPNNIQLAGNSVFLKLKTIREHNLTQDARIRPTFEDGEFIGRYLSTFSKQIVGIVSTARYMYRKRGDGSSLVQSSWSKPSRYDDVIRFGYLPLLRVLKDRMGYVPVWAQNTILYDIQWYLTEDRKYRGGTAWLSGEQLDVFQKLMIELFSYIDRKTIEQYNVTNLTWVSRQALLVRFKGTGLRPVSFVRWTPTDLAGNIKIGYAYFGELPLEGVAVDGINVEPIHAKSIYHNFFGKTYFIERVLWIADRGSVALWLNGNFAKSVGASRPGWSKPDIQGEAMILAAAPAPKSNALATTMTSTRYKTLLRKIDNRIQIEQIRSNSGPTSSFLNVAQRAAKRRADKRSLAARSRRAQELKAWAMGSECAIKYQNAWLVMDRVVQAGDNGEHLFRHLWKNRPDINAFFVLSRDSADWDRLATEGFRLVEYGSDECIALTLNARYKISSDATYDVQYPADPSMYGPDKAKVVFLQHGVTQHDLSTWLNPKNISLLITATQAEHDSISGDGSPYKYTGREVKLTGFPRFDNLYIRATDPAVQEKNRLLVMPTWRQELKELLQSCQNGIQRKEAFNQTEYGRLWLAALNDINLVNAAQENNLRLTFLAHPALDEFIDDLDIPNHVEVLRHRDMAMQEVLIESKVVVTDYSSIAFDAAYSGSTVFYFQFDRDTIFNGVHSFRPGYYDYRLDGFGPVSTTLDELSRDITLSSASGFERETRYTQIVQETFRFQDSENCTRVTAAIETLAEEYLTTRR